MMDGQLDPVVTLVYERDESGMYSAVMTVSGLVSELQAQAALAHMERLFCGGELEVPC